jgi:hypothetical protein
MPTKKEKEQCKSGEVMYYSVNKSNINWQYFLSKGNSLCFKSQCRHGSCILWRLIVNADKYY